MCMKANCFTSGMDIAQPNGNIAVARWAHHTISILNATWNNTDQTLSKEWKCTTLELRTIQRKHATSTVACVWRPTTEVRSMCLRANHVASGMDIAQSDRKIAGCTKWTMIIWSHHRNGMTNQNYIYIIKSHSTSLQFLENFFQSSYNTLQIAPDLCVFSNWCIAQHVEVAVVFMS